MRRVLTGSRAEAGALLRHRCRSHRRRRHHLFHLSSQRAEPISNTPWPDR